MLEPVGKTKTSLCWLWNATLWYSRVAM